MGISKKNYSSRVTLIIALSLVGFVVAIGTFLLISCEECFSIQSLAPKKDPSTIKCQGDHRCINGTITIVNTTIATDVGIEKVKFLQGLVREPIIQNALKISNQKNSEMSEDIRSQIFFQREKTWTSSLEPTPFMTSIIENDIADFLRVNHVIRTEENRDIVFGEHILTNRYGPNVAVSVRTDNYLQSNDDWWQQLKNDQEKLPFARECEFDSSAQMFSEDLVIGIFDTNDELIGIMNSATPCDVTQASLDADKSIRLISEDEYSEIGKHKIKYLQELMRNPTIQEALRLSNQEFLSITEEGLLELKETPWPKPGDGEPSDLQLSIIHNEVADILRENLVVESEEFRELVFPEMILTNNKGVNVASTDRTYNYVQNKEAWWIAASENEVLVRDCGFDRSIEMNSEDILIQIFNENREFVGILNSASICDIILIKPAIFYGDSN